MTSGETITLTRKEYGALLERNSQFEDRLVALDADNGVRVPHEVRSPSFTARGPSSPFLN